MMEVATKHTVRHELKKNGLLYLMFLPVGMYFLVLAYVPMPGIVVAFKSFTYDGGIFGSKWNGFENFRYFIESGKLLLVTGNTLFYNLVFLGLSTVVAICAGVLVAEMTGTFFKKLAQSFMFLPYFISWVTVSAFMYNLFNYDYGVINHFIRSLGGTPFNFYAEPDAWLVLLPLLYVWKGVGFSSVLYLSAIMGIDQECYESAYIDGANVFQRIRHITLPMLKPTVITLTLLGLSRIMRGEFDMFYQIIGDNGFLLDRTDIIDTLVFRSLVSTNDFGMASSAGFYQSVLCFVIIMGVNTFLRRKHPEYALF